MLADDIIIKNLEILLANLWKNWHFRVHNAYNLIRKKHWEIEERTIDDWMLIFCRKGTGYYEIDGIKHKFEYGNIYFISQGITHRSVQNEDDPANLVILRFGLYDNERGESMTERFPPFGFCITATAKEKIRQHFEDAFAACNSLEGDVSRGGAQGFLTSVFTLIYMQLKEKNKVGETKYDKIKLEDYIQGFIDLGIISEINLGIMAEHFNLSKKYFSRVFKNVMGVTFKDYVLDCKMNRAQLYLEETGMRIKDIAMRLGYSDQYAFSRQFKKSKGIYPSRVREIK